ncbi:MAG: hypothetical protein ACLPVY_09375 [Acidimicrobiia bacterium]
MVVEVTGPPWAPTGTDGAVVTDVPPGRVDEVADEVVDVVDPGSDDVEPWPDTGTVPLVLVVEPPVVGAVVDVEHGAWVVVVVPPGSDVVEPSPVTGVVDVVDVVVVVVVVAVVGGAVVDVEHTSVVVGATVVVVDAVVVVTCVDAGATLVVVDAVVEVEAAVEVEVDNPVIGGETVVVVDDVAGVSVVDVVEVEDVAGVQSETRSTDVLSVSTNLSGHTASTVKVIVPLVAPGTSVVAKVVPLSGTGFAYPITGYVCTPIAATAVSMVMASVVSLLPIDQSTT